MSSDGPLIGVIIGAAVAGALIAWLGSRLCDRNADRANGEARRAGLNAAHRAGFGDSMNWTTGDVCAWFASVGYEVHGIDYEAHGRSDGLAGLISSFDRVVDDVRAHFAGARAGAAARGLASFIFGESLGGAVAIHITQRDGPGAWAGAIFCAPMVKISDAMKPPACVISLLRLVERVAPTLQLLAASEATERLAPLVDVPFIACHGGADVVTDPAITTFLHAVARSSDKTLKIYADCWHSLLSGETEENKARVKADLAAWLDARSGARGAAV